MKAIITEHLAKLTRKGNSVCYKKINALKKDIINEIDDYIYTYLNNPSLIECKKFEIKIYNYKGDVIKQWEYIPTYR